MNADSQIILAVTLGVFAGSILTMLVCFFPWRQVFCKTDSTPTITVTASPVQNVLVPRTTPQEVV